MRLIATLGLSFLLFSCYVQTSVKTTTLSDPVVSGSCIQRDPTINSTLCISRLVPSEFDKTTCGLGQGTWSDKPCDPIFYGRSCQKEITETIDNGQPHVVIVLYYSTRDSKFDCNLF